MTRYFALAINSNTPPASTAPARRAKRAPWRLKTPGMWLMLLLFASGAFYLLQTNNVSTKGYEVSKLEARLEELKVLSEKLELEARGLTTIQTIKSDTHILNLVPAADASHVRADNNVSYQR